jgi:nucleoid-associated protein YgaU
LTARSAAADDPGPVSFRLNHPNRFAIVPNPVLVAGFATAFEGEATIEIHEGHDARQQPLQVGGSGTVSQFSAEVDLSGTAFLLTRLFVEIFEIDPSDGSRLTRVQRPVFFGPGIMSDASPLTIAPFIGWFERVVEPGDTLSAIALDIYGDATKWPRIHQANQHVVSDPDLIFAGQVLRIPH